ncbi:MAG: ATP-binding cassette domain-containing protein [Patescibacteria group bacterium]|jgi:sodium transport system ATP-binding protein
MLQVQGLTKKFGEVTAVEAVTFDAHAGEIFGLLGPNGAGKTTTIRVIATILQPTEGTAVVDGHDIRKEPEAVRKTLGLLTADIGVYDRFTARENLRYMGRLYGLGGTALENRIHTLLVALEMEHFADRRAGTFSTGMKQKVAIARSIIHDPKVVIFDEPTAGLDVLASQTVIRYMQHAKQDGKLVILSTHDMAHAQALCDRVGIIHRSKLITLATPQELLQQTQSQNLEEAFLAIVGQNAAQTTEREREEAHLRDVAKKRKKLFKL